MDAGDMNANNSSFHTPVGQEGLSYLFTATKKYSLQFYRKNTVFK
jgi:hypothetical protein